MRVPIIAALLAASCGGSGEACERCEAHPSITVAEACTERRQAYCAHVAACHDDGTIWDCEPDDHPMCAAVTADECVARLEAAEPCAEHDADTACVESMLACASQYDALTCDEVNDMITYVGNQRAYEILTPACFTSC